MTFNSKQFRLVYSQLTTAERDRISDKCRWEHMFPAAVMRDWPDLVPERLRDQFRCVFPGAMQGEEYGS